MRVALLGALHEVGARLPGFAHMLVQLTPLPCKLGWRRPAARERLDRYGNRAVPVVVKGGRQLRYQGSAHENVIVRVLGVGIDLKIGIADIAAADQGRRVVGNEQFIVHAIVEPLLFEQKFDGSNQSNVSAVAEGIENPHLDLRVRRHHEDLLVSGCRFAVVDQYAYMHAAIGRGQSRRR